ncbi:MAG: tetratricopeptide repeat protein [Candidatus Kapaibacteriota bacterium]
MKIITNKIIIGLLIITAFACSSTQTVHESEFSFYTSVYELYANANQLDSSTIKYIKNKYLIDLIANASKNEQLGLYHQAIVDLLDALRFDTSKVILFALARNFYYVEKYTLAFDYGFRAYLLDSNFVPTIELLAWTLLGRNQFKESSYFSNRLLKIKGNKVTQNDIKLHLNILDRIDTSYNSSIEFLKSISNPQLEQFVNSQLLYYYFIKKDSINQNQIVEKILSKADFINDSDFFLLSLYFTNLLNNYEYEKSFQKLLEFSPKTTSDNILKVLDYFVQRIKSIDSSNSDFTIKISNFVDESFRNDPRFQYKLVQMYFILGDTANVYKISKTILGNENTNLETLLNVSYILFYNLNRKDETIQRLQTFKYKFVDEPLFFNVLGEFYTNNKQYDLAEAAFKKSFMLDSNNYQIYTNLAWLYAEKEEWVKSDSFYLKSLEIFPDNPITLNNFAYSLIQRDTNLTFAGKLIEKAIKIRPDDPNLLDTYGWYLYKIKDYDGAKKYIEKSIEIDSTRPEPFLHLSIILRAMGKDEESRFYFDKAISIDANNKEIIKEIEKQKK